MTCKARRGRQLAMAALLAAACTDAFRPSSVVVQAPATTIAVHQTIQLSAEPLDADGAPIADRPVTWTSSYPSIASVSDSGLVTGVAPGTVTITATIDGTRGSVAIAVVAIPVATVSLVPDTVALVVPNKVQLAAVLTGADGDTLTNRVVTWLSSHPDLASVDGTGLVTAINEGSVTITATSEGKRDSASITVTVAVESVTVVPGAATLGVGVTRSFYTILTGLPGNILYGREVAWSSSNPAVATANPTGLVTGKTVGTATITATSEGVSGTATVTVVPCVATASSYSLVAPLPAVQSPGRTFVRVNDDVVRGAAPPRVPRSHGAAPVESAGCGELRPMAWDGQPGPEGGALVSLAWANPAAFAGPGRSLSRPTSTASHATRASSLLTARHCVPSRSAAASTAAAAHRAPAATRPQPAAPSPGSSAAPSSRPRRTRPATCCSSPTCTAARLRARCSFIGRALTTS